MPSSKLFQSWAFLAPNAPARVGEISPVGTQDDVGALAGVRLAPFSRSRHSAGVVSAIMGLRSTIGLIKGPQHSREVCYLFKGERWIQSQILFNAEPRKEHRYQIPLRPSPHPQFHPCGDRIEYSAATIQSTDKAAGGRGWMSSGAQSSTPIDSRRRAKLIHQCAGSNQIARVEALIEPLVNSREQIVRLRRLAVLVP